MKQMVEEWKAINRTIAEQAFAELLLSKSNMQYGHLCMDHDWETDTYFFYFGNRPLVAVEVEEKDKENNTLAVVEKYHAKLLERLENGL